MDGAKTRKLEKWHLHELQGAPLRQIVDQVTFHANTEPAARCVIFKLPALQGRNVKFKVSNSELLFKLKSDNIPEIKPSENKRRTGKLYLDIPARAYLRAHDFKFQKVHLRYNVRMHCNGLIVYGSSILPMSARRLLSCSYYLHFKFAFQSVM